MYGATDACRQTSLPWQKNLLVTCDGRRKMDGKVTSLW